MAQFWLRRGDCFDWLPTLAPTSVDLVLCDLPYGVLDCEWDRKLDLKKLWREWKRLLRPRGAVLLFAQQPFTTDLVNSNRPWFRYEWVWEKDNAVGWLNAKRMPMRAHESVLVFYPHLPVYNPQMTTGKPYKTSKGSGGYAGYNSRPRLATKNAGTRYPRSVVRYGNTKRTVHPTQKPVDLLAYLIRTYTSEGATVLDNCMGSGMAGVACAQTGRAFLGIEKQQDFFQGWKGTALRLVHAFAAYAPQPARVQQARAAHVS
jgi:site-specific DNA-methyltransferase (adenine-specific)